MKILKSFFAVIFFLTIPFSLFAQTDIADKKLNLNNIVFGIYDTPSEKEGMNTLYIYLKIPYSFFRFVKEDGTFLADYEFAVEVVDKWNNVQKSKAMTEKIEVSDYADTNSDKKIVLKEIVFEILPDIYNVRLVITDQDLKKSISQTKEVKLRNFWKDEIGISDIIVFLKDVEVDTLKNIIIPKPNVNINYNTGLVINYYIFKSNLNATLKLSSKIIPKFSPNTPIYEKSFKINDNKYVSKWEIDLKYADMPVGPYIFRIELASEKIKKEKEVEFSVLWENYPVLERDIKKSLEQMKYIFTEEEYKTSSSMNQKEAIDFFISFWIKFDSDTTTEKNEVMEEYFRRVDYSIQNFSDSENEGWKTDRGKIYILYGEPNRIINQRNLIPPYETWEYNIINKRYIFWDEFMTGIFKLKSVYDLKK